MSLYRKIEDRIYAFAPPRVQAAIDFRRQGEGLVNVWGGPLNGQAARQQLVLGLLAAIPFTRIVETGTFRAATTRFLRAHYEGPIVTIEADRKNYHFARRVLRGARGVETVLANSVDCLGRRAPQWASTSGPSLFYLDAHWNEYLPLRDELAIIDASFDAFVVMIDDFKVPGDPGYGYDDYGPGKTLDLDYLGPVGARGISVFFPSTPSSLETGARRGCAVLAKGDAIRAVLMRDDRLRLHPADE